MANYTTYEVKGEKESFEDFISNISPTDTRFTAITGEKSISNKTHQWQEDSLDAVASDPKVEGWDATNTTKIATVLRSNVTQIFGKDGKITDSNNEQDKYGRARELIYQKTKDAMALKRDIEHAFVGTAQVAAVGDASTARELASIQAQIDAGNTTDAAAAALTELMVQDLAEIVFNAGGDLDTLMVNPAYASVVSGFTGKATATNPARNVIENASNDVNGYVDVYISNLGQRMNVEYNRFLLATNVLLLDSAKIKRCTFRPMRTVDLAKVGSASPYMVEEECTLMNLNQTAHGLITNLA